MFSKKIIHSISLLLLAFFVSSCGTGSLSIPDSKSKNPKWYNEAKCPKGHLCGYGQGTSIRGSTAEKKAKANARVDLLSSISTLVNSELSDSLEEFMNTNGETYEVVLTVDNTTTIIEGNIKNSIVHKKDNDVNGEYNTYWVSVKLDIDGTDFNELFNSVARNTELSDDARKFIEEKKDWAEEAKENLRDKYQY